MPFEEFDNKVRQAADHHHPAYDQEAWSKMEKLLDKHLPQEKDNKRRFIFFLLFFLLLGGGAWLFISRSGNQEKNKSTNTAITIPQTTPETNTEKDITVKEDKISLPVMSNTVPGDIQSGSVKANGVLYENITGKKTNRPATRKQPVPIVSATNPGEQKSQPGWLKEPQPVIEKISDVAAPVQDVVKNDTNKEEKKDQPDNLNNKITSKQANVVAEQNNKVTLNDKQTQKKKASKRSTSFFFSFSAGPDLSFVSADKPGTTKLLAGGGVGFTLQNKLTIRTGFYAGRKVYSASPDNYNPPQNFWTYYPNMQKIDADCKVYEIPLSLSYNFGHSGKSNWFASAGISSLIMKKEVYNYYYKYTPTGSTVSRKWTLENENNHYFSVLTLSGGYQRKLGNHISLTAEPYVKLPLTGIGFGKVKLNSGGVLFTIAVNPFSKKDRP